MRGSAKGRSGCRLGFGGMGKARTTKVRGVVKLKWLRVFDVKCNAERIRSRGDVCG